METLAAPDMVEIVQAIVREELRKLRVAEVGVVTKLYPHESGSDKNNYACDVRLRDSGLELKRVPVATQRIGQAAIPNVDDLVLVQFVGGDLYGAVITGRLYNDVDRPPEAKAKEFAYVSPDAAESGIRRVWLEFPNGNTLLLDDDKVVVEMGETTLTVKHGGDVEVKSAAKTVIQSQDDHQISSQADTTIDSGGDISITANGSKITLQSQGTLTAKAATKVTVEAPLIELGQGAAHPAVFGDLLLQYLTQITTIYQTHIHPGEMAAGILPVTPAPPVPPMPPPTPSLLSVKVMEK